MPQPETLRDLRRGLEALTISALEGRLAFSRGVITYHFADKIRIVLASYVRGFAVVEEAAAMALARLTRR
jgi:AcrR family transcriptional regulator